MDASRPRRLSKETSARRRSGRAVKPPSRWVEESPAPAPKKTKKAVAPPQYPVRLETSSGKYRLENHLGVLALGRRASETKQFWVYETLTASMDKQAPAVQVQQGMKARY